MQDDVLLSHSAPAILRENPKDVDDKRTYSSPGEIIVWRWLGLNRFFPPDKQQMRLDFLRGCASVRSHMYALSMVRSHGVQDYQQSGKLDVRCVELFVFYHPFLQPASI